MQADVGCHLIVARAASVQALTSCTDVLDQLGHPNQAVKPFVRPLDDNSVLCGFARTGLDMKRYHLPEGHNPYALEMDLIDSLQPGQVAVLACDGPTDRIAPWGELLSTAAMARKAAGCVTDGLVRATDRFANTAP